MKWHRPNREGANVELGRWLRDARGVTTTEAVVLILLGLLIVLGGIQLFGGGVAHQYESVTRALTGADDDDEERGRYAAATSQEERTESGARATGDSDRESDGNRAVHTGEVERDEIAMGESAEREETSGSVGGVNPLIILLLIGGVLAVGYFIFADDD